MSAELTGELQTILQGAAFAPLDDRAFLRITGPDATRWLNGMVTNNIQALQPGEGNYNFLLNAQGRIQGDCTVYRDPEDPTYILETDKAQIDNIQQLLDKFIIMDDVELTHGEDRQCLLLLGKTAHTVLGAREPEAYLGDTRTVPGPLSLMYPNTSNLIQQITTPFLVPGSVTRFHIIPGEGEQDELHKWVKASGVHQASPETLEALRILEARPRYGVDIRNTETAKDLPQETNQPQALHFAKGCYLGQEIVERIRSRGQVHRQFTPFRLEGAPPTTFPTPLEANGKPAGELTSATPIPTTEGPIWLALGYARREALETKAILTYPGGTAHPRQPGSIT